MAETEIITGAIASAGRLDKALAEATGLSRARVQGLIEEGRVDVANLADISPDIRQVDVHEQVCERFVLAVMNLTREPCMPFFA